MIGEEVLVTVDATEFKLTDIKRARSCSRCLAFKPKGSKVWRPTHGRGGWARSATLCHLCMAYRKEHQRPADAVAPTNRAAP